MPEPLPVSRRGFMVTASAAVSAVRSQAAPPPIGQDAEVVVGGRKVTFETAVARNIAPGSTAGIPGLPLPAGLTAAGLPIALEFDGPSGADRALLALGASVERVLGRLPGPTL
jgi:Asp-tRNA(Asn)/Glu-tRNA(Gln) amidotransferase A subunit family amidase